MDTFDSALPGGEDEMAEERAEGETVPCLHIYLKPDGSAVVVKGEGPMPEDGAPARDLRDAIRVGQQLMDEDQPQDAEGMAAAMKGYKRHAMPGPQAPTPGAIFGE